MDPADLGLVAPPFGRTAELWGSGAIGVLFPDRGNGPAPAAITPWPQAAKTRAGLFDRALVAAAVAAPPPPTALDPRVLWCSQPGLTWAGVDHYLHRDTYAVTGTTWADQNDPGNLRPLVYVRHEHDGPNGIILSGHHRSAAALLAGRPVLYIVVDHHPPAAGPRMITERLLVGGDTTLPHTRTADVAHAARLITSGARALVPTGTVAKQVLVALGLDAATATWRIARAGAGDTTDQEADG